MATKLSPKCSKIYYIVTLRSCHAELVSASKNIGKTDSETSSE